MLELPLFLFALRAMAPVQSAFWPDAEVPGVREPPVESGTPDDGPPRSEVPVGPLVPVAPEPGGVFGATGLPVPNVRALSPDMVGAAD